MKSYKRRDLLVTEMFGENSLVIACDSCGAVGQKPGDRHPCPPYIVGRYTTRVALMEVLATGATVLAVTNNVCNELDSTGSDIIRGVGDELKAAHVTSQVLNGSTEENFETDMTAMGITVVGFGLTDGLLFKPLQRGDSIYLCGRPKWGPEVKHIYDTEIACYTDIYGLQANDSVLEIVPVGSKGILYEANLLAQLNGLAFQPEGDSDVDLTKSAGPATCLIAAVRGGLDTDGGKFKKIGVIV